MKFDAAQKKDAYTAFVYYLEKLETHIKWKWETGEKARVVTIMTIMSDELLLDDFEELYKHFCAYLEETMGDWLKWPESARYNLIGYLTDKNRIRLFASKNKKNVSTHFLNESPF